MQKIRIVLLISLVFILTACGAEKEIPPSGGHEREETTAVKADDNELNDSGEEIQEGGAETESTVPQMIKVLSEGDTAPDFTAALCNGESFKLYDHKDKVVLINFWATWCGPCVREMPAFEKLKADAIDGFELVCVNCMEDKKTVDQFVKDEGYTFNIAYDADGSIGMYYPTEGIPYTLIVDHGVISRIYVGAMDAETQYNEYKSAIEEAMK